MQIIKMIKNVFYLRNKMAKRIEVWKVAVFRNCP